MTNVFGTPEKVERRDRLKEIAYETLAAQGYVVERVAGAGKSSMRRLLKDGKQLIATIRTTQDRWFAFQRTSDDKGWLTLDDADVVVVVSVDDKENPQFALMHMFDQADIKSRMDRAYKARMNAKRSIPVGRGVWVSLYDDENGSPSLAGAGAGKASPPIARVPLKKGELGPVPDVPATPNIPQSGLQPLTISEAKLRLAITFGVDPSHIKITVEA
jgi:hypothetical protein